MRVQVVDDEDPLTRGIDAHRPRDVADEFRQYLNDSVLSGEYILLAADGRRIPIHYTSIVFEDGCMGARWEPLPRLESAQYLFPRKAS